jgi:hypothetical protein
MAILFLYLCAPFGHLSNRFVYFIGTLDKLHGITPVHTVGLVKPAVYGYAFG